MKHAGAPQRNDSALARVPKWLFVAVVPLIAAVAVAFTGFGSGDDGAATGSVAAPAGAGQNAIAIQDFTFSPDPVRVAVGTTVTVTNQDGTAHTITATKGAFDTGELGGGGSTQITVDRPGTYAYFCEIHQYMKGTLRAS
jgi:plastocyanin